jgi:site-specific DNA-methyltransferase (adenine-specific)
MGSGTTGVACMNTGRNFIGIEIDAGYCAIAERRIREAKEAAESKLFTSVA